MSGSRRQRRGTTAKRRLRPSDGAVVVVAVLAAAAMLPVGTVSGSALAGLTVLLVGWPTGLLAVLSVRWARQRDWRFIGLAVLLAIIAAASATASVILSR